MVTSVESLILSSANASPNVINQQMPIHATRDFTPKRGMVLPFKPLNMSFSDVNYSVDMPAVSYFTKFDLQKYIIWQIRSIKDFGFAGNESTRR